LVEVRFQSVEVLAIGGDDHFVLPPPEQSASHQPALAAEEQSRDRAANWSCRQVVALHPLQPLLAIGPRDAQRRGRAQILETYRPLGQLARRTPMAWGIRIGDSLRQPRRRWHGLARRVGERARLRNLVFTALER